MLSKQQIFKSKIPLSFTGKYILIYGVLSAIALIMLFPLLWLISTALKSPAENIFQFPPQFFPTQPTFDNFIRVWQTNPFGQYLFNSTLVAGLTVILNLLFSGFFVIAIFTRKKKNIVMEYLVGFISGKNN